MLFLVPRILKIEANKLDQKVTKNADLKSENTFRVFCSSERVLNRFWKVVPWESKGLLKFDGADIHYEGLRARGRRVQYRFPRNHVKITYLPPNYLRDSGLTWISIESHNFKFLFTSLNKAEFEIEDSETTTGIYRLVSNLE